MKLAFSLNESDYLTLQLYLASISERVKKQRIKSRVFVSLIILAVSVFEFIRYNFSLTIAFLMFSLFWYFLSPLWERRHYVNHFKRYVAETLKDRFGKMVDLEFASEFFVVIDATSEGKISNSEIEGIDEIPSLFIIRLKGGQSLPIPKSQISDLGALKTKLQELADSLGITFTEELDWRWR